MYVNNFDPDRIYSVIWGKDLVDLCCGVIGTSKFCLKPSPCGVAAHMKKVEVDANLFYVKENKSRAFLKPTFHSSGLLLSDIEAIKANKMTIKEFTSLFDDIHQGRKPDWLPKVDAQWDGTNDIFLARDSDELASPQFSSENAGMFALVPKLSFELDAEVDRLDEGNLSPQIVVHLLREYHRCFSSLKAKWTQSFLDVEASHALVVKDLLSLQKVSSGLKQVMGTPEPADLLEDRTILKDLRLLSDDIKLLSEANQAVTESVEIALQGQQDFRQTIVEAIEEKEAHVSNTGISSLEESNDPYRDSGKRI
jgi:hypothetical protein